MVKKRPGWLAGITDNAFRTAPTPSLLGVVVLVVPPPSRLLLKAGAKTSSPLSVPMRKWYGIVTGIWYCPLRTAKEFEDTRTHATMAPTPASTNDDKHT
jgi:hypothetical protein